MPSEPSAVDVHLMATLTVTRLPELVAKSLEINNSVKTSSWHPRRVGDAVRAYLVFALRFYSGKGFSDGTLPRRAWFVANFVKLLGRQDYCGEDCVRFQRCLNTWAIFFPASSV